MPHIKPLPPDEVPEFEAQFDRYKKSRGFVPNSLLTMARRPRIAKAVMQLIRAALYEGTVDTELKILVSLIASQASGCRYCQAHMAELSELYDVSEEKIAQVWDFEESNLFTDAERAALRLAVNASIIPNQASSQDFNGLTAFFDEGEVVEIVASIALFGYLNRWNDTVATELEEHPKEVAEKTIAGGGWRAGKHG